MEVGTGEMSQDITYGLLQSCKMDFLQSEMNQISSLRQQGDVSALGAYAAVRSLPASVMSSALIWSVSPAGLHLAAR